MTKTPTGQPHGRVTNPLVATTPEDRTPSEMDLSLKGTMLPGISLQLKSLPLEMVMPPTLEMTPQGHITMSEASPLAQMAPLPSPPQTWQNA